MKVDLDSLFKGKKAALTFVFDQILSVVMDWEGVAVSATANCIVFVKGQTFLIIRPLAKVLDLKFYLLEKVDDLPIYNNNMSSGKWEHHIRISDPDELDTEVFRLLRKSYELF